MINPKYITIAAIVGFCLSFFIGLISGVNFGHILLRAFIFAVVFSAIAVGVSFVYSFFLSSAGAPSDIDSPAGTSGSVVNITVDDDVLPDDEYSPKFSVENNRRSLGADALAHANEAAEPAASAAPAVSEPADGKKSETPSSDDEPASAPAFKPSNLGDMTKKFEQSPDDISDLPPIDDLSPESSGSFESVDDVSSGSSSSVSSSSAAIPEQNAQLMAQAISTILSKDDE